MSWSSLQKNTNTSKMLVFLFLVGLLSLTFLVFNVKQVSAASVQPTSSSTSNWTTTTIQLNWTKGVGGDEMFFAVASSTDNLTFTFATTTIPSTTLNYTFTGLATNTRYYFLVAAVSSTNQATSTAATSTETYTLANIPGTPTVGTPTVSALPITINIAGNPAASTTYSIYNTTTARYLDSAGADTTTPVWQTTSTWGASFAATGLTANTSYQFAVTARNGANTTTATSSLSAAKYTLTNAPSSASVSAGANSLSFSWTGDSTAYYVEDLTAGTNSTWITDTSFSVGGLSCGTTHNFRVKGRNAESTETDWASASGSTSVCGNAIPVNITPSSGASPALPATPAVPGLSPAVPATPATPASGAGSSVSLPPTASPVAVFVHTLRLGSRGAEVRALQQKLRELGYFKHPINTGFFGGVTKAAVVAFQKAYGLKPFPGHVGPATRAALNNL